MTVPIMLTDDSGNEKLLGVFNLESNRPHAFLEAHAGELMAAATKLAPEILVLQHLEADSQDFGWHPDVDNWTLEKLLDAYCAAVAGSMDDDNRHGRSHRPPDRLPRPSCTVWYRDPDEAVMCVRGTARFDYEYISRATLPMNSFSGLVANSPKGTVGFGDPKDIPEFNRKRKSEDMGMAYVFASPIYHPDNDATGSALGTINLYFFREELPAAIQNDLSKLSNQFAIRIVAQLAAELGRLIDSCQRLRRQVAEAYLRYRLHEQSLPGVTEFDIIKEVCVQCLGAHGCSLFARENVSDPASSPSDPPRRLLRCVTSTGLQGADGTTIDWADAIYDMDADEGLTVFLGRKPDKPEEPGRLVRCRSTVYLLSHAGDGGPVPINKFREAFSLSELEHRPFLGASVDNPAGRDQDPVGVIRVPRRSGSMPFVKSDELLLRRLTRAAAPVFQRWAASRRVPDAVRQFTLGAKYPFLIRAVRSPSASSLAAVERIGAEFMPGGVWNRRQVDVVLLDLINAFRNPSGRPGSRGALVVNFRIFPKEGDVVRPRVFAVHAVGADDGPSEEQRSLHEESVQSVGGLTAKANRPFTFDRTCRFFQPIVAESKDVNSGVCVPVKFLTPRGEVCGVISVDCDDMKLDDWRTEHLEVVALAAKKLDFVGRDNYFKDDTIYRGETWVHALKQFVEQTLPRAGVQTCNIKWNRQVVDGHEATWLLKLRTGDQDRLDALTPKPPVPGDDSHPWLWNEQGGFRLGLRYGAFKTHLHLIGRLSDQQLDSFPRRALEESMAMKLAEISHLWNRFIGSSVATLKPLFRVAFSMKPKREQREPGLMEWEERLSFAPDLVGRGAIEIGSSA